MTNGAPPRSKARKKRGKPHTVVRHHSISIPIYASELAGRTRYTIAFYRDGKRQRRVFTILAEARKEAKVIAGKILRGMQSENDLRPAERDSYLAAQRILEAVEVPLVAAVEDYAQCRKLLGDVPLGSAVGDYLRRNSGVKLGVKVLDVVEELIVAKEQDGVSEHYRNQLRSILRIFARKFTGPIADMTSEDID